MTYIENIFLCLALPLILSMFFIKGRVRRYALFLTVGMAVCLLSAYVSSFFMGQYGVDGTVAAIEITPVCEEVMKLLPLLFFYLNFEPEPKEMPAAAIGVSYVFRRRWRAATGTVGILGACIGFHAIYNLLITADGVWKTAGYLFPSLLLLCLYAAKQLLPKQNISFE